MSEDFQLVVVALIVAAAIIYLAMRSRKKAGCQNGGCGCGTPKKPTSPKDIL